jgi:hypothetical protein
MKRALVAAALGGILMVGTPTLALSAQRSDTRAEKGDKGGDKGGEKAREGRGEKGDRHERGDRDGRSRHGHGRHGHDHDGYYDYYYYGYPHYGYGDPYYYDRGYGYGYGHGYGRNGDVMIRGLAFHPPDTYIGPGQDVTWYFYDREPHTVTADNKSFDSGERRSGEFRLRFEEPGSYSYHCAIHPEMKGRVIVG